MEITFENYSIAPIHQKDAWRLCDFIVSNEDHLRDYFPKTLEANLNPTLATLFVERKTKEFQKKEEFLFTVKENTNRKIIGLVYVKELHKKEGQAELAYCIGYQFASKGLTTKAISKIIDWCFDKQELDTLQIFTHKTNLPSIRVAEKNGFEFIETYAKHHQMYTGEYVDMELYERSLKS